jgi:hypothetical protein
MRLIWPTPSCQMKKKIVFGASVNFEMFPIRLVLRNYVLQIPHEKREELNVHGISLVCGVSWDILNARDPSRHSLSLGLGVAIAYATKSIQLAKSVRKLKAWSILVIRLTKMRPGHY